MARSLLHRMKSLSSGRRCVLAGMTGTTLSIFNLLLCVFITANIAQAQAECALEPGAAPCNYPSTDPGSTSPPNERSHHVGNPIDVLSGNKYQRGDDYAAFASPLVYSRHYNTALVRQNQGLGKGWRDTYSLRLYAATNRLKLIQSDGRSLEFDRVNEDGATYATGNPNDGQLVLDEGARWLLPDGRIWAFSGSYPVSLSLPDGSGLTLRYKNQRLHTVTDTDGLVLQYFYSPGRIGLARYSDNAESSQPGHLQCLQLPDGSSIRYGYDQALNLVSVRHADGIDWEYQYNDERFTSHMTQATRQHPKPQPKVPLGCEASNDSGLVVNTQGEEVQKPWVNRWSFDEHGRADSWFNENTQQAISVEYDVTVETAANQSAPSFASIAKRHNSDKAYRYVVIPPNDNASSNPNLPTHRVDVQACEDCEWLPIVSLETPNDSATGSNETLQTRQRRRALHNAIYQAGMSVSVNRFGAGKIELPKVLHDNFTSRNINHEVCRDWLTSINNCEQLQERIAEMSAALAETDPIPMQHDRGQVLDWLFEPQQPRPPGTCPLPAGMTCAQLEDAIIYADLASCAYDESTCPSDWVIVDPQALSLDESDFEIGGFHAVLLYHPGRDEYVLSFEGTSPLNLLDWETNIQNHQNTGDPEQYEQAADLAADVHLVLSANDPDATLTFTGHSLGGGLASIAALNTHNQAVVFNSAAVGTHALYLNGIDIVGHESYIDVINMTGDPVTDIQANANWPALGTHYMIGDPNSEVLLSAHAMSAVQVDLQHLYDENCNAGP